MTSEVMTVPGFVFIDTSVFVELAFNFRSQKVAALQDASRAARLSLVVPDPTRREVERHFRERAIQAGELLASIPRRAPFVEQWKGWPTLNGKQLGSQFELVARSEWEAFKRSFDSVVALGYEGIDLREVMNWYDWGRAPFDTGKKKSEFPDAIVVASLLKFAESKHCQIAVVARDGDFKGACSQRPTLLYFSSLSALTEVLLGQPERVASIHRSLESALEGDEDKLAEAIAYSFRELSFYPSAHMDGEAEDPEVDELIVEDLDIVALGEHECTVAFTASVGYFIRVKFLDEPSWYRGDPRSAPVEEFSGRVRDQTRVSGVMKMVFSAGNAQLDEVESVIFDSSSVAVEATPDAVW